MREVKSTHKTDGFTLLFDALVRKYDLATAAIYGCVWRFCQMRDQCCYASVNRIAKSVGVSYSTALRRLKVLVDEGYLEDKTPKRRNVPHVYRLTGKLDIEHKSETCVVQLPSSVREKDDPSSVREKDNPSSVREKDDPSSVREKDPSSVREKDPSSVREKDEDTIRNNNNTDVVATLSDDERHALDALINVGFVPESDAIKFVRSNSKRALGWATYAQAENLGGGFVRQRLAAGDDPPQLPQCPQSNGEVFR